MRAKYCSSRVLWILLRHEVGYPQKYLNEMGGQPDLGTCKGVHCGSWRLKSSPIACLRMSQYPVEMLAFQRYRRGKYLFSRQVEAKDLIKVSRTLNPIETQKNIRKSFHKTISGIRISPFCSFFFDLCSGDFMRRVW